MYETPPQLRQPLKQLRAVGKNPDYMRNILIRLNEIYNYICSVFLILCMGVSISLITGAQLIDNYCEIKPLVLSLLIFAFEPNEPNLKALNP